MLEGKNVCVKLNPTEALSGAVLGATRRIKSKYAGLRDNHGLKSGAFWDMDIEGALTEMVLAKALGVYFDPTVDTFKAADLGDHVQVRSTHHRAGSLIVRPDDPDDHVYVLVISALPDYRIVGWIWGSAAKQPKFQSTKGTGRKAAYFVPQKDLFPFPLPCLN